MDIDEKGRGSPLFSISTGATLTPSIVLRVLRFPGWILGGMARAPGGIFMVASESVGDK